MGISRGTQPEILRAKFVVMDVANHDVLSADSRIDQELKHPVPLKIVEDGEGYKLCAGRRWIAIKPE